MTAVVMFNRKFSAAHRIASDPGVCQRIHGHNYEVKIVVSREALDPDAREVNDSGFVVPADMIKDLIDRKYDHKLILDETDPLQLYTSETPLHEPEYEWVVRVPGPPSTENLARWIAEDVKALMDHAGDCDCRVLVVVKETDTISAEATA